MLLMRKLDAWNEILCMNKVYNRGGMNIYKWLKNICQELYEEQAMKKSSLVDKV